MADRVWHDPEVTGSRRLPMHSIARDTGAWLPLDGRWRFQLLPKPQAPAGDAWSEITVPGAWTMQDVGDVPIYTNTQMPWPELPPALPADNPTGVYERDLDIPAEWAGRRIVLHVGAAESALVASLNGVEIGSGKDSHLASEFDITAAARPGSVNVLRLTVVKWSDGSYLEDQDQWWHGGLTRSVYLYATAPTYLADMGVVADLDGTTGRLRVDLRIAFSSAWTVSADLDGVPVPFDQDFDDQRRADERVSDFLGEPRLSATIPDVRAWSAEIPNRYRLTVRLHASDGTLLDSASAWVGFRRVEVVGNDLLINGARVFIRGVNRHDFDPVTGRSVTRAQMRADLVTMKQYGFNAVRTAHYPNDPAFLDLTDELGLYVVDEANIETHDHAHEIADDPLYLNAFVSRVSRMVRRDRNHPSVIIWSLGNESDYGTNHDAAAGWLRHFDPTRPIQYEGAIKDNWTGALSASDIVCPMYPSLEEIVAHARSGSQNRPLIMCEYSHAMGNSNGTLAEHWAAIESTPGLQGGFIWEFWDHGLLQKTASSHPSGALASPGAPISPGSATSLTSPASTASTNSAVSALTPDTSISISTSTTSPIPTSSISMSLNSPISPNSPGGAASFSDARFGGGVTAPGYRWAYGGDFGDKPNDGNFCIDGMVFPDRTPKPAMEEHREIAAPLALTPAGDGRVTVTNRQHFRDLSWLTGRWELTTADGTLHTTPRTMPVVPPGGQVTIDLPAGLADGLPAGPVETRLPGEPADTQQPGESAEAWLTLRVTDADGVLVCTPQLPLRPEARSLAQRTPTGPGHRIEVDDDGLLIHPALTAAPRLSLWRAPTDNDRVSGLADRWAELGLPDPARTLTSVRRDGDRIIVEAAYATAAGPVTHRQILSPLPTGAILIEETAVLPPGLTDVPRVGSVLSADSERFTWFGRGPGETYPDRRAGGAVGRHETTVDAAFTPYVRPQESGGRNAVRWLRLDETLTITLDEPRQVSVTRYRAADLAAATHHDELTPRPECVIHLDAAHRGLGTASCGPDTLPEYLVGPGEYNWTWTLA